MQCLVFSEFSTQTPNLDETPEVAENSDVACLAEALLEHATSLVFSEFRSFSKFGWVETTTTPICDWSIVELI